LTAEVSLKNQFLLAMPNQAGTYFGDTVTYVCEHTADGAMGLMINRPTDVALVELLSQLGMDPRGMPLDVPVMEGGPVAAERGFILHTDDKSFPTSLSLSDGVMLSTAREVLESIAAGNGPADYLVALGYAGWGEGQLEAELKENAWLTCPGDSDVIFNTPFEQRVNKAAAALGIDFRLMSAQAGHA
jgi:putative transcriptional regulator